MGKGQKGKGNPGHKKDKKPTQRSAQNKKQLAKVDRILQQKKDRSQSKGNDKGRQNNKFDNNRSYSKDQKGKPFQHKNRSNSKPQKRPSSQQWTQRTNNKTKQINKQYGPGKQMKRKPVGDDQQDNQPIKGNPLFKIIPQGMDDDAFAALGVNDDQEIADSQVSNDSQQGDQFADEQAEQGQGDQQVDEDQMEQQEEGDIEQGDFEQDELEGQDQQQVDEDDVDDEDKQDVQGQNKQQGEEGQQKIDQAQQDIENQNQQKEPVDISVISLKIQQTIQILMNVGKLGAGKSRKHYIQELKNLIHQYYGYNFELISHFLDFLNPSEMIQFFEANETQRPLTIRTNTLKTRRKQLAQALIQRGVNLDPLAEWSNVGIKIYDTKVPIGATPEYLAGHYMLQSASSLLPVIALDPQPYEKVLDMASAPGGKTTYIAQMMKNTGSIFANDLKKERLRALQFNLYRLGVTNTAVTCRDGRKFPKIFPGTFDRVLLDAPCTGLGIIAKDHSIKASRLMIDIYKNSHLQKELLLAAIDTCKVNGTIVYSTCSVSPLQNEEVVNFALKRRFIKIVECGIQVGEQGLTKFVEKRFHVDLKKTRRIYPHVHNMDGFYVAKLIKLAKGSKNVKQEQQQQIGENIIEEGQQYDEVEVDAE